MVLVNEIDYMLPVYAITCYLFIQSLERDFLRMLQVVILLNIRTFILLRWSRIPICENQLGVVFLMSPTIMICKLIRALVCMKNSQVILNCLYVCLNHIMEWKCESVFCFEHHKMPSCLCNFPFILEVMFLHMINEIATPKYVTIS